MNQGSNKQAISGVPTRLVPARVFMGNGFAALGGVGSRASTMGVMALRLNLRLLMVVSGGKAGFLVVHRIFSG